MIFGKYGSAFFVSYHVLPMNLLLIEDDAIETMKFQRVLKKIASPHKLMEAKNGEEALELLTSGNQLPDIILLDLNMPRMNGIEFLTKLKQHDQIKYLPTIILTTSENRHDLLECYKVGVAGYVIKPLKFEDYETKIKSVLEYWSNNELVKA
ncbi:Response regulator receiver domain-containing protein [Robiginitalea myxolifaciens]|uniref:Response regulator receiver domain-containing protein n=2 Tax=Robiginitalea myxolifaciens TaxID=400055 RepID=A0A1I6FN45_9FLAO|nr:Response regulator receiver domain-containing protein [Robiginitalea myxolifaciens]